MRPPVVDLAGQSALDHRHEPLRADVRGGRDRTASAKEHRREEEQVFAPEDVEAFGRSRQDLERVGVDSSDRLLRTPRRSGPTRARGATPLRGRARCGRGCCRSRWEQGSPPPPCGSARRSRPPRGARSTGPPRALPTPPAPLRALLWPRSSSGCCWCRCRRSDVRRVPSRAREQAATTACRSGASSADDSPVVPRATIPAAPASRYSPQRRSMTGTSTASFESNGVMRGTHTPRRSRSLAMSPQ